MKSIALLLGDKDEPDRKKELVAVEYGKSIRDVTPALIRDVNADLAAMPEYEDCKTTVAILVNSDRRSCIIRPSILGAMENKAERERK